MKLLTGGTFAVGLTLGVLTTVVALLFFEVFEIIPLADSAFTGAIVGALIAGAIGVVGQLLVIVQNENSRKSIMMLEERALLEALFIRCARGLDVFWQTKRHIESTKTSDNIVFSNLPNLMKPFKISDLPRGFSEAELSLSLRLSDVSFLNLMVAMDALTQSFEFFSNSYEHKIGLFLEKIRSSGETRFKDGKSTGSAEIDRAEHYELENLQENYIREVYAGILFAGSIVDSTIFYLRQRHGVTLDYPKAISADEWDDLLNSVDLGSYEKDVRDRKRLLVITEQE